MFDTRPPIGMQPATSSARARQAMSFTGRIRGRTILQA
jgi:hypothetical protein